MQNQPRLHFSNSRNGFAYHPVALPLCQCKAKKKQKKCIQFTVCMQAGYMRKRSAEAPISKSSSASSFALPTQQSPKAETIVFVQSKKRKILPKQKKKRRKKMGAFEYNRLLFALAHSTRVHFQSST